MLLTGSIYVRYKKFECRINIREVSSGKPIDEAEDDLICLLSTGKIGVEGINRRDRVDWVTRAIRSQIREIFYCLEREAMGSEFCER